MLSEPRSIEAVYQVRSSHGLITLEVDEDRYSCCYDPPTAEGETGPSQSDSDPARAWIELPVPTAKSMHAKDILYFVWAFLGAAIEFRSQTFANLLRQHAARRALTPVSDVRKVALVAHRFARLERWCPFRMLCFFRAIFLLRYLRLYGLTADWIFGAALFPFDAHCWLAAGPHLLTDRPDRILRFQILLAIDGPAL